jgi:hypothetical protein
MCRFDNANPYQSPTVSPSVATESKVLQAVPSVVIGLLMFIFGIAEGDVMLMLIGILVSGSGIVRIVKEQQKRAAGEHFVGQPQDVGAYGWERLEKLMENVDNPDTFIIEMAEQKQRSEESQARMAETFYVDSTEQYYDDTVASFRGDSVREFRDDSVASFRGDSVREFRDDSVASFRGDAVSSWSDHEDSAIGGPATAPSGKPSAVPKDFHNGSLFWADPTRKWSDPYA